MEASLRRVGFAVRLAPVMRYRVIGRGGALNPVAFPALTIFSSPRGVAGWLRRLTPAARRRLRVEKPAAAVVGPATARAARAAGFRVVAGARLNGADELAVALLRVKPVAGGWFVAAPAGEGRAAPALKRAFPKRTIRVVAVYAAIADPAGARALRASDPDLLVCGSPRQWALARRALGARARGLRVIVPGESTGAAVRDSGASPLVAKNFSAPALRVALKRALRPLT